MSKKYEGAVGSYRFVMTAENTIEVWNDGEHPESYIFLKDDSVRSEKDFQVEISHYYMQHLT